MSKPTRGSLKRMVQLARYLLRKPRLMWKFQYQTWPGTMSVSVGSIWAGCMRTRKSTSGGAAMLGTAPDKELEQDTGVDRAQFGGGGIARNNPRSMRSTGHSIAVQSLQPERGRADDHRRQCGEGHP